MTTFAQYRAQYESERERLENAFACLSVQESRWFRRDNPLLYSSRAVADTLGRNNSCPLPDSQSERQTGQLEHIAHQTLVPLRFDAYRCRMHADFSRLTDNLVDGAKTRAEFARKFCETIVTLT
jgi:hypothetical protein